MGVKLIALIVGTPLPVCQGGLHDVDSPVPIEALRDLRLRSPGGNVGETQRETPPQDGWEVIETGTPLRTALSGSSIEVAESAPRLAGAMIHGATDPPFVQGWA